MVMHSLAPKNKSYLSDLFWSEYTQSGVEAALKETIYKSVQHEYIVRKIKQFPKVMVKKYSGGNKLYNE